MKTILQSLLLVSFIFNISSAHAQENRSREYFINHHGVILNIWNDCSEAFRGSFPEEYAFVDIDGDGNDELYLNNDSKSAACILAYDGNKCKLIEVSDYRQSISIRGNFVCASGSCGSGCLSCSYSELKESRLASPKLTFAEYHYGDENGEKVSTSYDEPYSEASAAEFLKRVPKNVLDISTLEWKPFFSSSINPKLVSEIRSDYASAKQNIAQQDEEANMRHSIFFEFNRNEPGIGPQTYKYKLYFTPLYGRNGELNHRLLFATVNYNVADKKFSQEFLFDKDGSLEFYFGSSHDYEGNIRETRFYFGKMTNVKSIIRERPESGGDFNILYDGIKIPESYFKEFNDAFNSLSRVMDTMIPVSEEYYSEQINLTE